MEIQDKQVLQAFLDKELRDKSLELDEATLNLLYSNSEMVLAPPSGDTSRSLSGQIDSEGKITFESFKWYNLNQIKLYDLLGATQKVAGLAFFENNLYKLMYGLGVILYEFYPKMGRKFTGQDANLIYTIYRYQNHIIPKSKLLAEYNKHFPEKPITEEALEDSLTVLQEAQVIRDDINDATKIELKEKIKNLHRI